METVIIDPVCLSGGPEGGVIVTGVDWNLGETKNYSSCLYRRDTTEDAVFCGLASNAPT